MAIRLRRGLEADRTSITPEEGELLYVTDTHALYAGDGVTAGGNLISFPTNTALFFTYTQSVPASVWTITHGLGFYPNVTVVDSSDREVEGEVEYLSVNSLQITFSGGFSGKAHLS